MTALEDAQRRAGFAALPGLIDAFDPRDPDMAVLNRLADCFFSAMRSLDRDVVEGRLLPSDRDQAQVELEEALAAVPGLQLVTHEGLEDSGDREALAPSPAPRDLVMARSLPSSDR